MNILQTICIDQQTCSGRNVTVIMQGFRDQKIRHVVVPHCGFKGEVYATRIIDRETQSTREINKTHWEWTCPVCDTVNRLYDNEFNDPEDGNEGPKYLVNTLTADDLQPLVSRTVIDDRGLPFYHFEQDKWAAAGDDSIYTWDGVCIFEPVYLVPGTIIEQPGMVE